ncbi:hypothetical protein [Burkholderia sp. Ac-20365]|uniref:hypothetical protein n=1 Tax=Burkholderia sp. Ac-20365 TaxID=2703897 RepID=UPI00197C4DDF|nr:hypothetical protein [Burkholderia sp. Ac-20365]MBN3762687.1 hypothetical protein [Burkholderia sp. Ac-20365]
MPALHETARCHRCKRLHLMLAVIAASIAVAACGNDSSAGTSQEQQQQHQPQTQTAQQPVLATTFNAVPAPSASPAGATLQSSQPEPAHALATSPGGASAADSVVLAPPVIHTVD